MLHVEELHIKYRKKEILSHLSFDLGQGSFTAVLGQNGAGKSTLLSAIVKNTPYKGKIRLGHRSIASLSSIERAKIMAYLPQHLPAVPFTVGELAAFGRVPHTGFSHRLSPIDQESIASALQMLGISPWKDRVVANLSGGERQLAFLAMVFAQDTDLLVLDEPSAALDAQKSRHLYACLQALCAVNQKTVIAALHDLNGAVKYADHLLILSEGKQVFYGRTQEALAQGLIEQVFHVRRYQVDDGILFD